MAARAADLFQQVVEDAIRLRGKATVALAGGSTPEKTYRILAGRSIDWSKVKLFFGDERFVPLDAPASNYGMARRAFLETPNLQNASVFPVPVGAPTPEDAARQYEATLLREFGAKPGDPPIFDLILLGLGDDGHTASLFPVAASLHVTNRLVVSSPPGTLPPPVERVTFTFPLLNSARKVMFLVAGANKERPLARVLEEKPSCDECPAACVQPEHGEVLWLVDEAASGGLRKSFLT